eukprot:CAMPEP_0184296184 /NCGR_PEP_ID=MMETSP1049-20130417/7161_1 /TAXON_ID=77928 /ORGANISM="Proteomonas sulcata, Strain CCMP704" /LENGTH=109 /DNA_ID=CAMNT_0026605271 /DNA_START=80 /DNA_END=409 /DNA_ORIENTATION=-
MSIPVEQTYTQQIAQSPAIQYVQQPTAAANIQYVQKPAAATSVQYIAGGRDIMASNRTTSTAYNTVTAPVQVIGGGRQIVQQSGNMYGVPNNWQSLDWSYQGQNSALWN